MIQLDTAYLIRALVPRSTHSDRVRQWLEDGETLTISAIAWAEFIRGPVGPGNLRLARQVVHPIYAFGPDEASEAARLYKWTGRRHGSFVDCLVAATAIVSGAALATANRSDFRRFEYLGLERVE